ncbi:serine hydrolase domain-containing protein [Pseudonocardia charpentierae]|uniref:Serine hydrolase domain-containing protein n=1 Tax=Pseudonocardia charpentierae TaxID=3075545 RepID=A0ABU2NET8_9PSEU|nr:serine hydrolase domain-containing protein [Pseudonocardia sp. DSM 45834]MDT0352466.1 serine hydrolase domain-containing protein [Pseudonocardia sp. DSM 45834]
MTILDHKSIDELLKDGVASGSVPGVVAVVVSRDGLLYEGAAGRRSVEDPGPVTPHTMFRNASMTKALASVGVLQLVEQGRLQLEQPVASILPDFADLQVLDGFDDDQPRLRPPATQATIGQLLNHTAGHGYWFNSEDLLRYHAVTGTPNVLSGAKAGIHTPLLFDPGTGWQYGVNTDWLGQALEAVSGQGLDAYLAEHLFEPLGMDDTTFSPSEEQRARLMPVHARKADGTLVLSGFELPASPEILLAGTSSYGTATDYGRFMSMLLAGGSVGGARILRSETVNLAFTDCLGGLPLPEVMKSFVPEMFNDVPSLPVWRGWGLGFHLVQEDLEGMRRAGSGNWAGMFNTYFWVDRRSGLGAALFTQVLPFFDQQVVELLVGFEQAVYANAH